MLPLTLPPLNLHISAFKNAWDNKPTARSCTLAGLLRALTTFPVIEVANKLALPAWSPARFPIGAPRKSSAVADASCIVLDFDAGDPDAALGEWAGVVVVLHSTWSHTPAGSDPGSRAGARPRSQATSPRSPPSWRASAPIPSW